MTALVFVDTNVLLYAHDLRDAAKQELAQTWLSICWLRRIGRVSSQVLNEFYDSAITKFDDQIGKQTAREVVQSFRDWRPMAMDEYTIESAWVLQDRYKLSHWDALILSSAQQQGCTFVLSEEMGHQQRYDSLIVVNPFKASPKDLLPLESDDD